MRFSVELTNLNRDEVNVITAILNSVQKPGENIFIDKIWWSLNRNVCIAAIETTASSFSIEDLQKYIAKLVVKIMSIPENPLTSYFGFDSLTRKLGIQIIKEDNTQQKEELFKYAEELKQKYYDEFQTNKAAVIQEYEAEYAKISSTKEQNLRALVASYKDKIAKIDEDLKNQLAKL